MFLPIRTHASRCALLGLAALSPAALYAQAPAAPVRQLGTVKSIDGNTLTLTTSAGATVVVNVGADVPVLQLPPGSTDLKAATPAVLGSVAVGDRVLVTARPGDTAGSSPLTAARVVLTGRGGERAASSRQWTARSSRSPPARGP